MELEITHHAARRYMERVRPGLNKEGAFKEIEAHLKNGVFTLEEEPPAWKGDTFEDTDSWLMLGDDVAFPVCEGRLLTCVTAGGITPEMRKHRNGVAKSKRRSRRYKENRPRPVGYKNESAEHRPRRNP